MQIKKTVLQAFRMKENPETVYEYQDKQNVDKEPILESCHQENKVDESKM